ncbi:MAG: hypothetical protein IH914_10605 [candidate division Zixibacteria bacterium]|nr:hypothetical protein [candidate division Zixibacteria bacterium]
MKKNVMLTALVLLALSQPLSALTRDRPALRTGSFEIQPSVGLALGDDGRGFAFGFGLRGFYNLSEFTSVGLRYGRTEFVDDPITTEYVQQSIQAEFRLLALPGWFRPYLMAFAGRLSTKIERSSFLFPSQTQQNQVISNSLFTFGAGLGYMERVSGSTEIFFEGVVSNARGESISYNTGELRAGLSFSF